MILMDCTVSTGAAAMMAVRVLLVRTSMQPYAHIYKYNVSSTDSVFSQAHYVFTSL